MVGIIVIQCNGSTYRAPEGSGEQIDFVLPRSLLFELFPFLRRHKDALKIS